jgi:hypothetical protein
MSYVVWGKATWQFLSLCFCRPDACRHASGYLILQQQFVSTPLTQTHLYALDNDSLKKTVFLLLYNTAIKKLK